MQLGGTHCSAFCSLSRVLPKAIPHLCSPTSSGCALELHAHTCKAQGYRVISESPSLTLQYAPPEDLPGK